MLLDDLGRGARLLDAADVERAVLAVERADAAHVVAVARVLLAPEHVERRVGEDVLRGREAVEVGALDAAGEGKALGSGLELVEA